MKLVSLFFAFGIFLILSISLHIAIQETEFVNAVIVMIAHML